MPGEARTRFIKDRYIKSYSDGTLYVRTKAFEPRWEDEPARFELSTFGIDNMKDEAIWELGFDHYLPAGRKMRGRADLPTQVFMGEDLDFVAQPPPPTHGSFVAWSDEEEDRLQVMAELADRSRAIRHPLGKDSPRKR